MLHIDQQTDFWIFELDRPTARNALSPQLVDALLDGLEEARIQRVPVVVLRGSGRNFCSGFDLSSLERDSDGDLLLRFVRIELLRTAIECHPALTIGLAHGNSVGAGVDLWAACRLRFADPQSTFRVPGIGFELVLGTRRFVRVMGEDAAHRFISSGEQLHAESALKLGLVTALIARSEWPSVLEDIQRRNERISLRASSLLRESVSDGEANRTLAELTRSAAAPGLKQRVQRYLEAHSALRAGRST